MPRKRHIRGGTEVSSRSVYLSDVTGDASMRLEHLSANPAGPLWNDITANTNNGTPTDATILTDFVFDGVVDFVNTPLVGNPQDSAEPWTIALWCVRDSSDVTTTGITGVRSGTAGWELRDMNGTAVDQLDFDSWAPAYGRTQQVIPAYSDDKWHYIAITWTPAFNGTPAVLKGYGDGALHSSNSVASYVATALAFVFGKSPSVFWDGKIDTARVYPRVLSLDEIKRDYFAGMAAHQ